jgi:uncharacterized protein YutE (UPF0331/DUF86 family)
MRTQIIETKIVEIRDNLSIIQDNLPNDANEFVQLGLVKDGIYKKIEFCIQSVYDICSIINTDLHLGIPEGDESIIDNLEQKNIFTKKQAVKLKRMKGFRNILVHRYGKIDDELAFEMLKNNLDDFYDFLETIGKYIIEFEDD